MLVQEAEERLVLARREDDLRVNRGDAHPTGPEFVVTGQHSGNQVENAGDQAPGHLLGRHQRKAVDQVGEGGEI